MLATWGNRGPAIVYRVDGLRRGPTSVRVGYVLPVWRSAAGRVFLAYLPERETAPLLADEEGDRIDRSEIDAEIARIRAAGFAITGDGDEFSGIAAPVLDHDGTPRRGAHDEPSVRSQHARAAARTGSGRARSGRLDFQTIGTREGLAARPGKGALVSRSIVMRAAAALLGISMMFAAGARLRADRDAGRNSRRARRRQRVCVRHVRSRHRRAHLG